MEKTEDDGDIGAEVESRLDELFSEGDDFESDGPLEIADSPEGGGAGDFSEEGVDAGDESGTADYSAATEELGNGLDRAEDPVHNLRALVSEIEWEITDGAMQSYLDEVGILKEKYGQDTILLMFLRLHESIGRYIRARKARAHPDAIKFVTTLFVSFEKVIRNPEMPKAQQKRLLSEELKSFKAFKARLQSRKRRAGGTLPEGAAASDAAERTAGAPAGLESPDAIERLADQIVQKLRDTIAEEISKAVQVMEKP